MSTPPNALQGSAIGSRAASERSIPALQSFLWSGRREFWENRSLYVAPLVGGGLAVLAFLVVCIRTAWHAMAVSVLLHQPQIMAKFLGGVDDLLMGIGAVVSVFYCLDALYGERRDRSILFWKSLPISDLTAVLAKASVVLLALPLIVFCIAILTQLLMLLIGTGLIVLHGQSPTALWFGLSLGQRWLLLFCHLYAVHALLYAPFYCWFLLVSAWAPRSPFLWAFLPPLLLGAVEKLVFNTTYFAQSIGNRLAGSSAAATMHGQSPLSPGARMTPGHFLADPHLWTGLALAAVFLAGTVYLRRRRGAL